MKSLLLPLAALTLLAGLAPLPAQLVTGLTAEQVAANPQLWPRQVATKVAVTVPVVVNGQASGSVTLPAGQIARVVRVEGAMVQLEINGSPFSLPASQTDLLASATTLQQRLQAQRSSTPPVATPPPPAPGQKILPAGAKEAPAAAATHALGATLKSDLVTLKNNAVTFQKGDDLAAKKYVALYFSARWCGPCRQFTPKLVQWYQGNRNKADQFEIVFVSSDTSAQEQAKYMQEDKMPWPAVDWGRKGTLDRLKQQFGGRGIPCLVVIDATGKVVSHSYEGGRFVGPGKVLNDLAKLIGG